MKNKNSTMENDTLTDHYGSETIMKPGCSDPVSDKNLIVIKQKQEFIKIFSNIHQKRHFSNKILKDFIDFTMSEIEDLRS